MKILSNNKDAGFHYFLSNEIECGFELTGAETKSVVAGNIALKQSYVKIINNEVFLIGATITPAQNLVFSYYSNFDDKRDKKLLLHKKQIKKYQKLTQETGTTLVMKNIYVADNGKIKGTVCLAKGKKLHDKRNAIKERDLDRASESKY